MKNADFATRPERRRPSRDRGLYPDVMANKPTLDDVRRLLTPAMREALGTAPENGDLSGHTHGSTLNALVRHGLARRERGHKGVDAAVILTGLGIQLRDELRARVDEKLAEVGFASLGEGQYQRGQNWIGTRGIAMQMAEVNW